MKKLLLSLIFIFSIFLTTNAGFSITNMPSDTYSQNIGGFDYIQIDNVGAGNGVYGYYSKPYMAGIYNINGLTCSTDTNFYINMADSINIKGCYEGDIPVMGPIKIVRTTDSATVYSSDFDIMLDPTPPPPPPASTGSLTNSINNITDNGINTGTYLLGGSVGTVIATLLALIILGFIVVYVRGIFKKS